MAKIVGKIKKKTSNPTLAEVLQFFTIPENGKEGTQGLQGLPGERGERGEGVSLAEVKKLIQSSTKPSNNSPVPGQGQGSGGGGAPIEHITTITSATYVINKNELKAGTNIFGVNFAGTVTITLPPIHHRIKDKIIVIKDESGNASSNIITVQGI